MDCPSCGSTNPPEKRFCGDCGAALRDDLAWSPPQGLQSAGAQHSAASATGAERRQLTVMFVDLAGSTAMSARLDPEDMREVIRAYQRCVAEEVARFDGHVAKYMGDGILVYFGYPKAHEDDAERAVRAGLEAIRSINELGDELRAKRSDLELAVRIGIATGPVIVDSVGEGSSRESAALGQTPHLAARLQALATTNSIVIATTTRRLLGGLFVCEELGEHELKGFSAPVKAWKVVQHVSVESRFDATRGELTKLVGRESALDTLVRRWERTVEGNGQVILISGEAGIGKSRLIQGLCDHSPSDTRKTLRYQCSPHYTNSALYPVVEHFQRAAGVTHLDTREQQREKLAALLARSPGQWEDRLPLFAALLSVANEEDKAKLKPTPQQRKQDTFTSLYDQICALAATRPVLIIVEDVHWIDPTTLELLDLILPKLKNWRVLALLTFRPEFQAPWEAEPHVTNLVLNRLSAIEVGTMLENVAGGSALPATLRDLIVDKTDGVPLFVEELTRTVLESGIVRLEGDRYVLDAPLEGLSIPATLQDSLTARLDRLAAVKDVAQIGRAHV